MLEYLHGFSCVLVLENMVYLEINLEDS